MKHILRNIFIWTVAGFLVVAPLSALAEEQNTPLPPAGNAGNTPLPPVNYPITINNPLKSGTDTLPKFIEMVLKNVVIPIGAVIAALFIVYAGFMYVTARGSEEKIATAHRALLYAVIGTAVLLGSWVIAKGIESTITQVIAP